MENYAANMLQKLVLYSFFILVNDPKQPLHKKLSYFFLLNTFPFNRQSFQKQKRRGISEQSVFRLQNKFTKISLLVMYYLTKFDGAT